LVEISAFAKTLKRAREERGVPLDAVASATRIARHHLDALERGDLESLPSGPFGRSYLRSYAEFLGLDPEPILHSYRSQEADKGLGPAESREKAIRELSRLLERRPERKRFPTLWVLGAVVAAPSLFGIWWFSRGPAPAIPAREPFVQQPAPAAAANAVPPKQREPEPPQAKEPSRPTAISVSESALGTGVVDHTVTGRANRFSEGERVLFWTRVLAAKPGDVIHHYWVHEGRAVMRADLRIGGPHWRTFSRYTLPEGASGNWVVEARDETGRVLAREEFLCLARGE
jgi:transcriptional regulator with XRE-family HTH domain